MLSRVLLIAFTGVHLFAQPSATIEIDARKVVHPAPRTAFGGFMEPRRSAIYTGGLWAQLLDNPSFEDNL